MARGFGDLFKLYGIVTYRVSPMHLKAFYGVLSHGVPNVIRRTMAQLPYVGSNLLWGVAVYYGVDYLHHKTLMKRAGEYDNDE